MPYYVFKMVSFPIKQLELIETFDKFKDASAYAKTRRSEIGEADKFAIKVQFGENQLQAEEALNEVREPQPMLGDDY